MIFVNYNQNGKINILIINKHLRMETKKKLNRNIHGEGTISSPNMNKVTIYLVNPIRKGSTTGRGSKDFKTTHTFKDVKTFEEAFETINQFAQGRIDGELSYYQIKKAYYNGQLLISDGVWIKN